MQIGRWGRDLQNVYTDPLGEGPPPGQEALSKGGVHLPTGQGEGGSEAISKGCIFPGTGASCHSCLCSPNLNWGGGGVGAEQGGDRVPEAKVSALPSSTSGAQELFA